MVAPVWTWAWTPPNGDFISAIGQVFAPTEPLTRQDYRFALMSRIERMVMAVPRDRAIRLLRVAYDREGLDIRNPSLAGELLVENSDALREHCPFPWEPVPIADLKHEPATLNRLLNRPMGLVAFLRRVYPPIPDWRD